MLKAADKPVIKISTENVDLIYRVGDNGRLYQSYLGKRLNHATDIAHLPQGSEAYLTHGIADRIVCTLLDVQVYRMLPEIHPLWG